MSGGRAEGTVVKHDRREIGESVTFHPVVAFLDREGTEHRFTSNAGWSNPAPKIGTAVQVRYLVLNPARAYIYSFLHFWGGPVTMFAVAIGALVAAMNV